MITCRPIPGPPAPTPSAHLVHPGHPPRRPRRPSTGRARTGRGHERTGTSSSPHQARRGHGQTHDAGFHWPRYQSHHPPRTGKARGGAVSDETPRPKRMRGQASSEDFGGNAPRRASLRRRVGFPADRTSITPYTARLRTLAGRMRTPAGRRLNDHNGYRASSRGLRRDILIARVTSTFPSSCSRRSPQRQTAENDPLSARLL